VLAGIATGIIQDPHVLKDWLEFEEAIQPNPENTKIYDQYYEEYKKLYVNTKDIMKSVTHIGHQ
jgi:ribulokinase